MDHRKVVTSMRDEPYQPEQIGAYGATEQPAIAARMTPHLRLIMIGAICSLVAVLTAIGGLATFPAFSANDTGAGWAVTALVTAVAMLAVCVIQVLVWRRAMASWRGVRIQDLHGEARLSWIAHLVSYAIVLVALWACIAGSVEAGLTAAAAVLLAVTLLLIIGGQVLAGVQYLRPSGPPGTLPAHMRRLIEFNKRRND
jgi:hypothetical protein